MVEHGNGSNGNWSGGHNGDGAARTFRVRDLLFSGLRETILEITPAGVRILGTDGWKPLTPEELQPYLSQLEASNQQQELDHQPFG